MKKLLIAVLFLALLIETVSAQEIVFLGVDTIIHDKKCENEITITLKNFSKFEWVLFFPIENFNYSGKKAKCEIESREISKIKCLIFSKNLTTITFRFETKTFVKKVDENKFSFLADFSVPHLIKKVVVMIKLPEKCNFENVKNVLPYPTDIKSDGKKIFAIWTFNNVTNYPLRFSFIFECAKKESFLPSLLFSGYFFAGLIIAILLAYISYYKKRKHVKIVLSILDPSERKVLEILSKYEKPINQKKIVEETNFSKAKVSRIISSLLERKIVKVERRGRNNYVELRENIKKILRKAKEKEKFKK